MLRKANTLPVLERVNTNKDTRYISSEKRASVYHTMTTQVREVGDVAEQKLYVPDLKEVKAYFQTQLLITCIVNTGSNKTANVRKT
jgi:hypothetical protein